MRNRLRIPLLLLGVSVVVSFSALTGQEESVSHARVVRLSYVEGTVTVQRPGVDEWAEAPLNTPIQEGFKLSTAEGGFAEVEFENTSTARLGQLSQFEFTQLALDSNGGKLNRMELRQGYATLNFIPEREDVYEVAAQGATMTPRGKARFRIDLDEGVTRVEVFKGSVDVAGSFGSETLESDAVLEFRPEAEQPLSVTKGITRDAWDAWVDERESQTAVARTRPAPGMSAGAANGYMYGWSDLYNYGNWAYLPGRGYAWSPWVGAGWMPYSYGHWTWYPGYGWVWVSYEPWGWLPYHFGEWIYQPGFGWVWLPDYFDAWSPAFVYWYQGPGWIGWSPAPSPGGSTTTTTAGGGTTNTATRAIAVGIDVMRRGGTIRKGNLMPVEVTKSQAVPQPGIQPEPRAWLPGRVFEGPANGGSRFAGGGVVFDPATGHYVNNDAGTSGKGNTNGPRPTAEGGSGPSATPSGAFTPRPGPPTTHAPNSAGEWSDRPSRPGAPSDERPSHHFWGGHSSGDTGSRSTGGSGSQSHNSGSLSSGHSNSSGGGGHSSGASVHSGGGGSGGGVGGGSVGGGGGGGGGGHSSSASSSGGGTHH